MSFINDDDCSIHGKTSHFNGHCQKCLIDRDGKKEASRQALSIEAKVDNLYIRLEDLNGLDFDKLRTY